MIDTRRVATRRILRFKDLNAALADARRCVDAERQSRLERLGNWTTGQLLGHLAYWIDGGFDGYAVKPPWFVKLIGPLMKKAVTTKPARVGMRLPGVPGGTYGVDELPTDVGLERFARAAERLMRQCPEKPNPVFGKMTHEQWIALHTRHAEGHLGFLVPRD